MFRPTIVFVEIGKHQNIIITELTITVKGVRRLKHSQECQKAEAQERRV
jgi:uncharacterized OsmC-like protein